VDPASKKASDSQGKMEQPLSIEKWSSHEETVHFVCHIYEQKSSQAGLSTRPPCRFAAKPSAGQVTVAKPRGSSHRMTCTPAESLPQTDHLPLSLYLNIHSHLSR